MTSSSSQLWVKPTTLNNIDLDANDIIQVLVRGVCCLPAVSTAVMFIHLQSTTHHAVRKHLKMFLLHISEKWTDSKQHMLIHAHRALSTPQRRKHKAQTCYLPPPTLKEVNHSKLPPKPLQKNEKPPHPCLSCVNAHAKGERRQALREHKTLSLKNVATCPQLTIN